MKVPVIDVGPLVKRSSDCQETAQAIGRACRDTGFFYVSQHGVDETLQARLVEESRKFLAQTEAVKQEIRMARGGRAWRGYFPVGGELTSGKPDLKEGIYFGAELSADHPSVKAGLPLHGPNLFPSSVPGLRAAVLEYTAAMTKLGHTLMEGLSLSLGLSPDYFSEHYTKDPLILFRIFNYPAPGKEHADAWGVGEHTDYGVLTILKQDDAGGLEVRSRSGWIAAPPIPGTFVCNIGDMLDRMTKGLYRSTPHRVKNTAGRARLSFPFFFDPNFHAEVKPLPLPQKLELPDDKSERWDRASVHEFKGTYGEYLLGKVSKVFPELRKKVLE